MASGILLRDRAGTMGKQKRSEIRAGAQSEQDAKDETEDADEILDLDTTVTLVREQKPEKLLRQLGEKYELTKRAEGIYRICGVLFPVQFLVTSEMSEEGHVFLTSLARTMSREQAQRLLDKTSKLVDTGDRKNADSVVNVASEANIDLFKKMIQKGDQMCEELKEMLAPEIVEFKILLAEQNAKLADKDAEIKKLKKLLAEAGIKA